MFDFFRTYQFDMMTGLIAISVMIAIFASVSKVFSPKRQRIIVCLALGAACLVFADRLAYAFRGVDGTLAFVMVRLTNFAVFAFSLINLQIFNEYLKDLYLNEGGRKEVPLRIKVVDYLVAVGVFIKIINIIMILNTTKSSKIFLFPTTSTFSKQKILFSSWDLLLF